MRRFSYNHPLRKAWRTNTGCDTRYWYVGISVGAFLLMAALWYLNMNATELPGSSYTKEEARNVILVLILAGSVGTVFVVYRDSDKSFFPAALTKLEEMFGKAIAPETSMEHLYERATAFLQLLARLLDEAEEDVGFDCHNNALYNARNATRINFAEQHGFLLKLGLADPKWDKYFRKQ